VTVYLADPDVTLYHGDALETLRTLPDESVHCVVTSPPYWGLRDYSAEGQMGLEATPELYVQNMVAVFREVRRVLRRDGTCWLNIGDSYNANAPGSMDGGSLSKGGRQHRANRNARIAGGEGEWREHQRLEAPAKGAPRLKPKDLVGIPWRLAFALQQDGWWLRADIIWAKPNPMPESVTDRPTKAHEYVFLLTRSPRYYYDQEAVREPAEWARWGAQNGAGKYAGENSAAALVQHRTKLELQKKAEGSGRNVRSVWEIATEPFPQAHFATFPTELARRCILAGTSERGCCPECGSPWEREVERGELARWREEHPHVSVGWRPTCDLPLAHRHHFDPVPCTVLDPFAGACTVPHTARKHGRHSIGIELSETYLRDIALPRLQQLSLLA